jgi:hypothetical protein
MTTKTAKRIYRVSMLADALGPEVLVRAASQAQAIGFVARHTYSVAVASQADLVRLLSAGGKVLEPADAA